MTVRLTRESQGISESVRFTNALGVQRREDRLGELKYEREADQIVGTRFLQDDEHHQHAGLTMA